MKAIILDMYGVIVKQTGDDFVPYVQQTFPNLNPEEICKPWNKADMGEVTSLDVWAALGFQGDLEKIEQEYLDTIELNDGFLGFIEAVRKKYKLAILLNDSSRWSKYLREKFNINQYFDVISISGDLKIRKPDERIFLFTMEKLAVKPEYLRIFPLLLTGSNPLSRAVDSSNGGTATRYAMWRQCLQMSW